MARISKCDALPEQQRLRLVGLIGEGWTWRELSAEFGIPFPTIHEWAVRNGYQRSPTAAKRKMVEELLARPEPTKAKPKAVETEQTEQEQAQTEQTEQIVEQTEQEHEQRSASTGRADVDAAAHEDARDMRLGLSAARLALQVSAIGLNDMRKAGVADARATKVWSECVAVNVATIRKIRGLDDTNTAPVITIERSYGKQS